MSKHRTIPVKVRREVYNKCHGHCAYCGCRIDYSEMQVDHIRSVYQYNDLLSAKTLEELNDPSNLLPSCRSCNFYKGSRSIESFRQSLEETLFRNATETFQFRLAEKYGLVERHPHKIRFFFETMEEEQC